MSPPGRGRVLSIPADAPRRATLSRPLPHLDGGTPPPMRASAAGQSTEDTGHTLWPLIPANVPSPPDHTPALPFLSTMPSFLSFLPTTPNSLLFFPTTPSSLSFKTVCSALTLTKALALALTQEMACSALASVSMAAGTQFRPYFEGVYSLMCVARPKAQRPAFDTCAPEPRAQIRTRTRTRTLATCTLRASICSCVHLLMLLQQNSDVPGHLSP